MGSIVDRIVRHYSDTHYERAEKQLENEKWLIKGVPFNRYYLMPAAVLIQVCCGSLYAWSGFNLPIEHFINSDTSAVPDRGQASITFYLAVAVFGVTAAILGPWLERNGPLRGALLGALLFYVGNLLTALGVHVKAIGLVYFGYGIVGGAGLGVSYSKILEHLIHLVAPVSPLQKWFPELRGLAAGLAVCGFGAGSIFSPYTQKALIGANYQTKNEAFVGVPLTFVILGSCYFVIMCLCALVLRMPPPGYVVQGMTIHTIKGAEKYSGNAIAESKKEPFSMTLAESLTSREYILTYFMFMMNELTGLLVISKIQSIMTDQFGQNTTYAANINSALGGMNLLGRLVIPVSSDLLKQRKPFFLLSLCVQSICLGCLPSAVTRQDIPGTLTCAFLIAFFYGSGFGIIPAFLADQFGSGNVGATHGVILTSWSVAGVVGGLVFNEVYKQQKAILGKGLISQWYNLDFQWILGFVLLGLILCVLVPADLVDRKLPKAEGQILQFRFLNGRIVRLVRPFKFVMLTKDEEMTEWNTYIEKLNLSVVDEKETPSRMTEILT